MNKAFFAMDFLIFFSLGWDVLVLYYIFISIVGKPIIAENSSNVLRKKKSAA